MHQLEELIERAAEAEREILESVRLQHGDDIAASLSIVAKQARTLAVMMVLQTTARAPNLPPVVETVLCTQIPQLVSEITTDSVFLALRHIEDDAVRADLTRFAIELASRSVDLVGNARTALLKALKP